MSSVKSGFCPPWVTSKPSAQVAFESFTGEGCRCGVGLIAGQHPLRTGHACSACMQPDGTSKHCPARKVTGLLSRVMVISPPRTNALASKSWQWLGATKFGFTLVFTTRNRHDGVPPRTQDDPLTFSRMSWPGINAHRSSPSLRIPAMADQQAGRSDQFSRQAGLTERKTRRFTPGGDCDSLCPITNVGEDRRARRRQVSHNCHSHRWP